ncbi:hypothetical protein LTR97_000003 [Elasticomyces elasticus]|uniref:NACHT domain-containing protein n=1 Tax=Elasticomyces elasticus TaxID=574655 RepID=A0AAN7VXN9_9PEZI|nr:hypothetical protein LTR97_000003 [Elasticomyces elasticus]
MDPASAIGVAAAVLQFLEFSVKVLKTCKEIRDDANSATQNNRELEKAARTLEDFRAELGSVMRSKHANRRIVTIAYECAQTAKELIDLLEYIRGGDGKLGTAKATWRAMLKRKPIERLQRSLQEREAVLDKVLNQDTNTNVQVLREEICKLGIGNRASVDQLSAKLSSLSLATNNRIGTAERNMHRRFDRVERRTQQSRDDQQQQQNHERFLSSLFFPEIDQRRSTVKAAYPDTFQWIFDVPGADDSIVPSARPTAGFGSWLRADASVYWISGKAGSGKSTLLAFILNDSRTREALQLWSPVLPVHLLSFFFWRAGSELQKSVLGLLRSLLYQLSQCVPTAIGLIVRELDISLVRLPTWTEKTLMDAIKVAMSAATGSRFCMLVDGLDELVGDYDGLVDLVLDVQALENVKCCVSSRPEIELYARLVECQRLQLQDLNRSDISALVSTRLADVGLGFLREAIVGEASGVFLWAVLVTQSVVKGYRSGDDWQVLHDRLKHMPKGLEALFARMVDNIDPQPEILLQCTLTPFLSKHASKLNCRYWDKLRVYWKYRMIRMFTSNTTEAVVFVPGSCKEAGLERMLPDPSSVLLCTEVLGFEHRRIQWIHRSAFEYVFPPDNTTLKPTWCEGDTAESANRLMRGATGLCIFAPTFIVPECNRSTDDRISSTVHLSSSLVNAGHVIEAVHGLDELRATIKQLHCSEEQVLFLHSGDTHDRLNAVYGFWLSCRVNDLQYVLSRLEAMLSDFPDTTLLTKLVLSHESYEGLDWITVHTRILQSIQARMQTAATLLTEPKAGMSSIVIPGPEVHINDSADRSRDHSYVASYAPGLTDLQFDARGDPDFYLQIALAAIVLLCTLKNKRDGDDAFDVTTRSAVQDLCEQLGRVMEIIKMNVSMLTRTRHCGFEYILTLQIPWRPLAMSLLEGKRPFENDKVPEVDIVYFPVTEPHWEREVFQQSILFRLRHETSELLASMLVWEGE